MKKHINKILAVLLSLVLFTLLPMTKVYGYNNEQGSVITYTGTAYIYYDGENYFNVTNEISTSGLLDAFAKDASQALKDQALAFAKEQVESKYGVSYDSSSTPSFNPSDNLPEDQLKEWKKLLRTIKSGIDELEPLKPIETLISQITSDEFREFVQNPDSTDKGSSLKNINEFHTFSQELYENPGKTVEDEERFAFDEELDKKYLIPERAPSVNTRLGNQDTFIEVPGTVATVETAQSARTNSIRLIDTNPISYGISNSGIKQITNYNDSNQSTNSLDSDIVYQLSGVINDSDFMKMQSWANRGFQTINYWLEHNGKKTLEIKEIFDPEFALRNDQFSMLGDLTTMYKDLADLSTGNLYSNSSFGQVTESSLLFADATLAFVDLVMIATATTCPPALFAATVAVSVFSGLAHSEEGGKFLDSLWDALMERIKGPNGIGAYKPNIYIYTEDGTTIYVTVTFLDPDLLTTTIPDYSGIWQVEANHDGVLTDAEGTEYGYLFYESETLTHYFQTEKGWLIKADSREEQYREILSAYGFSEREIDDFIEYWVTKLDAGKDYMMYPQDTKIVDRAMPVVIDPTPEEVVRIWFAFDEETKDSYTVPQITAIERDGYTVLEWGGVILSEE